MGLSPPGADARACGAWGEAVSEELGHGLREERGSVGLGAQQRTQLIQSELGEHSSVNTNDDILGRALHLESERAGFKFLLLH